MRYLSIIFLLVGFFGIEAQITEKQNFRVMCYNAENFFDCVDDSLTNDNDYLPGGSYNWNYSRYENKQASIAKVIVAAGGWNGPALVGLCEVESEKCMRDLTRYSGLKNLHYRYFHHESPDPRGIDVALLYQPRMFKPFHDEAIRIHFPDAPNSRTRDILFVSGVVPSGDSLHIFVCHFPSRLGGELESESRRMYVASVVRTKVDSIFSSCPKANVLIMGDFNDYPTNKSLLETMKAKQPDEGHVAADLYNMMYPLHLAGKGTHKDNGEWGALDQIIVSGNLLNPSGRFYTLESDTHVFDAGFLLEDDTEFLGKRPFRTYSGFQYKGGFSDHLPVFADFWY